jgi:nicotinamide mononucleotide transporter
VPDPIGWLTANWIEVLGFATGVASVWLFARQHVAAWPVGIVTSLCWLVLFLQSGLYADSGLQVFYVAVSLYGWWHWLADRPSADEELPVTRTPRRLALGLIGVAVAGTLLVGLFLDGVTDSTVPFPDAATTILSLVAYFLLARKHIENWPIWIFGVNLPYLALYLYKGLVLTAALQPLFIALSIRGWVNWRRDLQARQEVRGTSAEAA